MQMRLKSYFAGSVEAAISLAGKELGEDAMILYSREAPPEARHLGRYEVVLAVPPVQTPPPVAVAGAPGTAVPEAAGLTSDALDRLRREIETLRKRMEDMAGRLAASRVELLGAGQGAASEGNQVLAKLAHAEVDQEVIDAALRLAGLGRSLPLARVSWGLVRDALSAMVRVDARVGHHHGAPRALALIGPPGSGKTTTLVKLAATYGLAERRPVQFISVDTTRIGGAEQLRSFASILGVGFQAVDTVNGLARAVEEHRGKDLILIDTPGQSGKDLEDAAELARWLAVQAGIDVHLTLTASMKPADLRHTVERYEGFAPKKLIFTRLDETATYGSILNEAVRTGLPLSFFTCGQQIPEDLEEANAAHLLDAILGSEPVPAAGGSLGQPPALPEQLADSSRTGRLAVSAA